MEVSMTNERTDYPTPDDLPTPLNWRVTDFCNAFKMGRTKFYNLVSSGEIQIVKCGGTTLITNSEVQRFQSALEAGDI
jgi:hypothetical protein